MFEYSGLERTPAFVFSRGNCAAAAQTLRAAADRLGARLLYSTKACSLVDALEIAWGYVNGFSVSSLFEARLARQISGDASHLHYVSGCVRLEDLEQLASLCNRITLNSLGELERGSGWIADRDVGVRCNPDVSFLDDARYDPCRSDSKLGVCAQDLVRAMDADPARFRHVRGLHVHSNCDSDDAGQLAKTVRAMIAVFGDRLRHFQWLNLGGGYTFSDERGVTALETELSHLRARNKLEITVEPGAAMVRNAGSFVSTVQDLIQSANSTIAILDLTVNHWPEVFEYQFEPEVSGHREGGAYEYILAGCSCLAGDLFGRYVFDRPLAVGSRIAFRSAGAYSIVKANMFNGINLPSIYVLTESGELVLRKEFSYEDFASRCGVEHALI